MLQDVVDTGWTITESEFDPARLHHRETLFTIGNGYLSTRGAFEEGYPGAWPATLIHGVFDDAPIVQTELANCPDWLSLLFSVGGERFRLDQGEILRYERRLDLHKGLVERQVRWRSPSGRVLDLCFERFISMDRLHVLALRCQITPISADAEITVQAGLSAYAHNCGLMHWEWLDQGGTDEAVWLRTRTRHSGIELGMAARLDVRGAEPHQQQRWDSPGFPALALTVEVPDGGTVSVEKRVTVFTSRDADAPASAAQQEIADLPDYVTLRTASRAAWGEVWRASDVMIEGDPQAQLAVRQNVFEVLIAAPRHDDRVSIAAKTLSGFGYHGHVFWDTELFALPILIYTQPELARNLVNYRYHTLEGARRKAKEAGYEGAMYPWESALTGDEVTPRFVPGPQGEELVRIWTGDIELHITADVAYGVWHYWRVTGDDAWMARYGSEIILDTAVFWGSRVEENQETGYYEITDVIGPDEYHEHVDNNAFTNRMVQWHLRTALRVLAWLRREHSGRAEELERDLDLSPELLEHWSDVIGRLRVIQDSESGLFEQFEGYFDREDVSLAEYEPRTMSMQAVLGINGTNRSQVLKQPDVLMLLYLLREQYNRDTLRVNWDYYAPRTDHTYGSSLGPAIHAILAAELGMVQEAYTHFNRGALMDLEDLRGNTGDGIHGASAGAVWQAVVMGFGGLRLTGDDLTVRPRLPLGWTRLKFRVMYRGQWHDFDLQPDVRAEPSDVEPRESSSLPDVRAVIFDLDGVLTDTSELHYQAWQRLADEEGIPFDRRANEALRGVSRRDSLMLILDGRPASEEQIQEMMARKNRYYVESIKTVTPDNMLPGALPLLEELQAADVKVAVGSASKNARAVIERLGIADQVDAIADGHSVEQQKPAPDLFLYAAEQLDVTPQRTIVVEDAASGVEAGSAAGMWTVGLGPPERVGAADVVLASLEGVDWRGLLERLGESASKDAALD